MRLEKYIDEMCGKDHKKKKKKKVDEASKPKWFNDPHKFREGLASKLVDLSHRVRDVSISDRYWPGDVDSSKAEYTYVNRVLKILDDAVFKLETEIMKANKIKKY